MHPSISDFPSEFFYNNQLIDGITQTDRPTLIGFWPNDIPTVILHNSYTEYSDIKKSVSNNDEAKEVLEVINQMTENSVDYKKIVVITPYEAQKNIILQLIRSQGVLVDVVNVDEFQGSERDYVIFSTVRSNSENKIGFLSDYRRLNVAITRARFGMVILGNCEVLLQSDLWRHILKFYLDRRLIFEGNFGRLRLWNCEIELFENFDFGESFDYFS